jgi:battenin
MEEGRGSIQSDEPLAKKKGVNWYYVRNWVGLFILGLINNLFYVVVNTAGQSLCSEFHREKWVGAILWCNISFGILAKLINMFFLENTGFGWRITLTGLFSLLGLVGISLSIIAGPSYFPLCLFSIVLIGTACCWGENVLLGWLKLHPPQLVAAWSSGTGMAGVGGSLLYAFFITPWINLKNQIIFGIVAPLAVVYILVFFFVVTTPKIPYSESINTSTSSGVPTEKSPLLSLPAAGGGGEGALLLTPAETRGQRIKRCWNTVWWLTLMIFLVYVFEYISCTGGGDSAERPGFQKDPNWFIRNSYVAIAFCYQLGVFFSRSSLSLFKIRRVEVLIGLQGINMVYWILQGRYKWLGGDVGVWFLFLLMLYVGLLGGASYVNVFYLILHNDTLTPNDREFCVNIAALANTVGISVAAMLILLLRYTVWNLPWASSSSSSSLFPIFSGSNSTTFGW